MLTSPEPSIATQEELIDRAIAIFEPRAGRPLTREEGRQAVANLTGFFRTLMAIRRRHEIADARLATEAQEADATGRSHRPRRLPKTPPEPTS